MNKVWKYQKEQKPYKYLKLGNSITHHVVFEKTPDGMLNIFLINGKYDLRQHTETLDKEQMKALKQWINNNIIL